MKFFSDHLLRPFAGGIRAWNTYKQNMSDDFRNLKKQNPKVVKKLNDKVPDTTFTNDTAIRVYLWNKAGKQIPNISLSLQTELVNHINKNPDLKGFANALSNITKIKEAVYNPDSGLYARLRELESWKETSTRIIWMVVTAVVTLSVATIYKSLI